jgi:imidazolonepropionase-like amidohydrolase
MASSSTRARGTREVDMYLKVTLVVAIVATLVPLSASADEGVTAIRGGRILPISQEPIANGVVLIENGKIKEIGPSVEIPEGAEVIDATGKWILPGLIESHTTLGIADRYEAAATDEVSAPNTAQMSILDAVNPFNKAIKQIRMAGITSVLVTPGRQNVIGGQPAVVKLRGKTVSDMAVLAPAGVKLSLGEGPKTTYGSKGALPGTRMGAAYVVRQALTEAREYSDKKAAFEKKRDDDKKGEPPPRDLKLEPLAKLLDGTLTAFIECYRVDDIQTALRLIDEFELKAVLVGATEGYRIPEEIARRNVPVIVSPFGVGPRRLETQNLELANARRLLAAGVKIAIKTEESFGMGSLRELPLAAALTVKGGLDPNQALRAITLGAAEVLGIEDRMGSLEPGKDADIVIFNGDPLHYLTRVERVLIDGETVFEKDESE